MQYRIEKGCHYSNHAIKYHFGIIRKKISFLFSPSCLYSTTDNLSVNKLFGWSYGHHHTDSVRVGWRPDGNGKICLFFYCYNKKTRFIQHFTTVDVSEEYTMKISIQKKYILFELYKIGDITSRGTIPFIRPWFRWGYFLYFYFGGKNPAPQDMTAYIFT